MLDGLRGRQQAGVQGRRARVLLHDFLALLKDSLDRIAGPAPARLAEEFEANACASGAGRGAGSVGAGRRPLPGTLGA
jgi:hypothetical protein